MKSENDVTQSCPTLCNSTDCSPPGFSIHGVFQARILAWVTISFSRGSSTPRDRTQSPSLQADALPSEPQRKSYMLHGEVKKKKKKKEGNSHIVQCESSALSLPRALVQSLVGELRSCKLCGWPKLEKKKIDRSGSPGMDSGPLYVVCDKKPQHRL